MDQAKDLWKEIEVELCVKNAIGRACYAKYGFNPIKKKANRAGWQLPH